MLNGFSGHLQPSALLLLSWSYHYSLLVPEFHFSVGNMPGREQSHGGTNFAGVHVRVFHEALFLSQRITALQQPALFSHQYQHGTDAFVVRYEANNPKYTFICESQFHLC